LLQALAKEKRVLINSYTPLTPNANVLGVFSVGVDQPVYIAPIISVPIYIAPAIDSQPQPPAYVSDFFTQWNDYGGGA
jgi:hypothetical protein